MRCGADLRTRANQRSEFPRSGLSCRKHGTREWASGIEPEERPQTPVPHRSKPSSNARTYLLAPRRTSEQMSDSFTRLSALTSTGRKTKMRNHAWKPPEVSPASSRAHGRADVRAVYGRANVHAAAAYHRPRRVGGG